jgi:hypothetical protein
VTSKRICMFIMDVSHQSMTAKIHPAKCISDHPLFLFPQELRVEWSCSS